MVEKTLNVVIDHLKKSPVLQEAKVAAEALMEQINENFKRAPVALEVLVNSLSDSTDSLILNTMHTENIEYLGGELIVSMFPQRGKLSLNLKLYFKSTDGKILLKENLKQLNANVLTSESLKELDDKVNITFVVEPPLAR